MAARPTKESPSRNCRPCSPLVGAAVPDSHQGTRPPHKVAAAIAEFITATLPTDPYRPVLCRGRAIAAQLPHSPAGPVWVRRPHTRLQTGLAHIQRRDPLHHQFDIVDFIPNARFADERLSGSVAGFRALYRDRGARGGGSVDRGDLARGQRDIGRTTDPIDADV